MKKCLLFVAAMICLSVQGFAHDFEALNYYGVTIYYNITSDTEPYTVEVTYRGSSSNEYDEYAGNVVIPASVTYNGTDYSVTSIGYYAFAYCSSLTSVTIPNSVTSIGYEAFMKCSSLTSVTIGNSVNSIGSGAFRDCSSLTSITIPNSVTSIGGSAFSSCSSLTSFVVENSNTSFETMGNGQFLIENNGNEKTLIAFAPYGITSVIIPNSVTSIESKAFFMCTSLTSVTIGNSVTNIGQDAFKWCSRLTSVNIPKSVTSIGNGAFSSCRNLTSVNIPNSVTNIEDYTFSYCNRLTSVTIPNSVTSIGDNAFKDCRSLTSIQCEALIPPSCGDSVFNGVPTYIPLTVPCNCSDVYRATAGWSNFTNIIELSCDVAITVSASPAAYGTVSGGGDFTTGDIVTVTATANDGYHFESWTEGGYIVSTNATYSFTAISSQNLIANFAPGTGLEEKSLQNFAIYPNPTSGIVNLDVEDVQYVEIMDINGIIIDKILNTNNIDLSSLEKGIYILRISLPQGSTMRRVVKI